MGLIINVVIRLIPEHKMSSGGFWTNVLYGTPEIHSSDSRLLKLVALLLSGSIQFWLIQKCSQRKRAK